MNKILKTINSKFGDITEDLSLLLQTPKDYLYLFTYPTNKFVKIEPYTPGLQITADKIINKISRVAPDLKVYFVGSASFHILGQGDIDLLAGGTYKNFEKYLSSLTTLFGKPTKRRKKFMEWHFMYNNYKVELLLADPSTSNFRNEIKINTLLRKNKKLLKEYKSLKTRLNGLSVREYTRRRMVFFNRILKYD